MTTTAVVTIGKKDYPLAPLVFDQMERAWPFLQKHTEQLTPEAIKELGLEELRKREVEAARDAISIIVIALEGSEEARGLGFAPPVEVVDRAELDPAAYKKAAEAAALKIRKTMHAGEIMLLRTSISNLLVDSGLSVMGNVSTELDQIMQGLQTQLGLMGISEPSLDFLSQAVAKEAAGA